MTPRRPRPPRWPQLTEKHKPAGHGAKTATVREQAIQALLSEGDDRASCRPLRHWGTDAAPSSTWRSSEPLWTLPGVSLFEQMKVNPWLIVVGASFICALHAHRVQAQAPSTREERAKVVGLTRSLERDPFDADAPATRQWLEEWIIEVPDIRVYACDELLGSGLGDKYPYAREVLLQPMFSAVAFAIEHQGRARDEIAQYHAGVEGALRVYEALLKSKPDARSAFLDALLAERDHGELVDHIAKLANEKCKRANTDLIASLAGAGVGLVLGLLLAWWSSGGRARRVTALESVAVASDSTRMARISRRIVVVCAAYFVIVVSALHVLEPDFDPRYRFMSEYVWGAYGWLMTTTFFALGLAAFTVAAGLRRVHQSSWSARLGFGLLAVGALFVCLAGVFKDFLPHLAASAVAIPSIILAALLLSWSFRQSAEWHPIHSATLLIALGMLIAFMSINTHFAMPGLLQRAFILLFLLWLSIVAHRLVRVTLRA